jgi:eukaryotic-like serine/threonine-protein kinase
MKQGGQQQQRYRVVERLASGGMAEVFLAESAGIEGFKKRVAIKRVLPHLSEKKRFIAMFLDEARLSAHLTHSNVAQVFDIGVGDNAYFIVMEYVDGSDLKAVIEFIRKTKRVPPVEVAVHIGEKICEGLSYAHEAKNSEGSPLRIVHRDVSPANVLITKYGEIKIVDFGLAKATSQLEKSEPGIVKGKFGYLSPEATQGLEVDARADVFATGILLWELLAQRRLFQGENDLGTIRLVREAIVPPLAPLNKEVTPELEKILAKALARDPEKRFQTARELGRALNGFLFKHGKPVGAHEVAELVNGTVALRKTADKEKDTTLSKLIEEALLEFKSLDGGEPSRAPSSPTDPRGKAEPRGRPSHFEDIGKWAEEVDAGPLSGEARSARLGPGSRKPESGPAESAPAETVKATPVAKADAEPVESLPAETVKATPAAKAGDSSAESLPADTIKSVSEAEATSAKESLPAPTLKATPKAKAGEAKAESPPAKTAKATPKKRVKPKPSEIKTAIAKQQAREQAKESASGKVMWLFVAAALLLLAASAYYGGLITH